MKVTLLIEVIVVRPIYRGAGDPQEVGQLVRLAPNAGRRDLLEQASQGLRFQLRTTASVLGCRAIDGHEDLRLVKLPTPVRNPRIG